MRLPAHEAGQASVEYLLVGLVLVVTMGGLAALWRFFSTGGASDLATTHASHAMETAGGLLDALLF